MEGGGQWPEEYRRFWGGGLHGVQGLPSTSWESHRLSSASVFGAKINRHLKKTSSVYSGIDLQNLVLEYNGGRCHKAVSFEVLIH